MLRVLASSMTGLDAQRVRMDITANNVANLQTCGFKPSRAVFSDLLYSRLTQEKTPINRDALEAQVGVGARVQSTLRDFASGTPLETGRALDLCILGEGFFAVSTPDGEQQTCYTRNGTFYCDPEGRLVTASGAYLIPDIQVPEDASGISISADGTVTVVDGQGQKQDLGRISLFSFPNPDGLDARGDSFFAATEASGEPTEGFPGDNGLGLLRSGCLEASNSDLGTEMVNMVEAYRAFQINARMLQTGDEMWGQANHIRD